MSLFEHMNEDSEHLQTIIFRRLVLAGFIRSLTNSITNMIDSIIAGRYLGTAGLSAMKLALPIFSIFALFSVVLGSGLSVVVSKDITRGRRDRANKVFQQVFTVAALISLVMMAMAIFCPDVPARWMAGASADAEMILNTSQYLRPLMLASLAIILYDVIGYIILLEGKNNLIFYASIAIFGIDITGDFLTWYMNWGIIGLAASTALSYVVACMILMSHYLSGKSEFSLRFALPKKNDMAGVFKQGLPLCIYQACNFTWSIAANHLMLLYGTAEHLAALSVQDALRYVPKALTAGATRAVLLLAGIFRGEEDSKAIRRLQNDIVKCSFFCGSAVAVIMAIFARPLISMFTSDPTVRSLGVYALLVYLPSIPFLILNGCCASFLQGIGKSFFSSLMYVCNRLILPLASMLILCPIFEADGIYLSFAACELAMTALFFLLLFLYRKVNHIEEFKLFDDIIADVQFIVHDKEEAVQISQAIHEFFRDHGATSAQAYQIALCAEELCINSLEHGFNDGRQHHLEVRAALTKKHAILRLRDDCRPFDLTAQSKMLNTDDPSQNLGLKLVFAAADDISYSFAMNMNNICIRIKTGSKLAEKQTKEVTA